MPLTFPSHAAVVVPLWSWRPQWFDLIALVVGSTAPDLAYALHGIGQQHPVYGTHHWLALFWWSLPAGLLLTVLLRFTIGGIAAHLPAGSWLRLPDYGVLGSARPLWTVAAPSVLIGAASHLTWDFFTHPGRAGSLLLPILEQSGPGGQPWWQWAQWGSTTLGALITIAWAGYAGRSGLIRRAYGPPPARTRNPVVFWLVTSTVALTGLAAALAGYHHGGFISFTVRMVLLGVIAPAAGAISVRAISSGTRGTSGT
jgi:hypothetical protein